MNLKDILAISGESTLFKFIAQGKNAVIVENLETGRRFSAGAHTRVSALDEISIFTNEEDMPLAKVMDRLWEKENGGESISHRQSDEEMKQYFAEVVPEYDRDRVYTSDIRKVIHWYNILQGLNLLVKEEPQEEEQKTGEDEKAASATEATTATEATGATGATGATEAKTEKPGARTAQPGAGKQAASSATKSTGKKPAAGDKDGNK